MLLWQEKPSQKMGGSRSGGGLPAVSGDDGRSSGIYTKPRTGGIYPAAF